MGRLRVWLGRLERMAGWYSLPDSVEMAGIEVHPTHRRSGDNG